MCGLSPQENFLTKARNFCHLNLSVENSQNSYSHSLMTFVFPVFLHIKTLQRGFQTCQLKGRIYYLHESFILGSNKSTRSFNDVIDNIPSLKFEVHESSISSAKSTGGTVSKTFCPETTRFTSCAEKPSALQILQVLLRHCAS